MKEWLKKHDILYKLLAFGVAVFMWLYVVNVVNQTEVLSFKKLQPTFIGSEELLNSANLMVTSDNTVSVEVSGKRSDLINLSENQIQIAVDISKCKEAGVYTLPYVVKLPSGSLQLAKKNPAQITVFLDKIVSTNVPVRVVQEGSIANGYMADEITATPKTLSVTGLQEEISQISYARVRINKKNIINSILEEMEYEFCDANDKVLSLESIMTDKETVEVSMPVLKMREVPLSIEILEGGGAYNKNVTYTITPERITVAADPATIDALDTLVVGVADLSAIYETVNLPMQLTLPENIKNVSGETDIKVKIELNGLSRRTMKTTTIEVINIPKGYSIEPITNYLDVQLRGSLSNLNRITTQNVRAVADLESIALSPGKHTIDASIIIDGQEEVGAIGSYKIVVNVKKK